MISFITILAPHGSLCGVFLPLISDFLPVTETVFTKKEKYGIILLQQWEVTPFEYPL